MLGLALALGRMRHWLVVWHVLALGWVLVFPSFVIFEQPFWSIPERHVMQVPVLGLAYLAFALVVTARDRPPRRLSALLIYGVVGLGMFGAATVLLLLGPDLGVSRSVVLLTAASGLVLALLPGLVPRWRGGLAAGLFLALAGLLVIVSGRTEPPSDESMGDLRFPAHHTVRISTHRGHLPEPEASGGALAVHGPGFIVVTGAGEFFEVGWEGDELRSRPLDLVAPMNREEFIADNDSVAARDFRVTDLLLGTTSQSPEVFVSHLHWNREEACIVHRVSRGRLPEGDGVSSAGVVAAWETVFETTPCIGFAERGRASSMAGGRMAWSRDGRLLFTTGDHGHNGTKGTRAILRDPGSDYGKILLLDLKGGAEVVSSGHRNPQGLALNYDGQIWSTEHGPRGGDELNLIVEGADYGWPFATYGTDYESGTWPLAEGKRDHAGYQEPVYSWVPSIGVSNLIVLGDAEFPAWQGDLLVGSLVGQSLFRIRIREGRVIYAEPIQVGFRVRDLAEGQDGRVLILTDSRALLSLAEADLVDAGAQAWAQCAPCHERAGAEEIAPSLEGVFERRIAALPDFPYSDALESQDGWWTTEALDAFLEDPAAFAPGTIMVFDGIPDAETRRALIEFLKDYGR